MVTGTIIVLSGTIFFSPSLKDSNWQSRGETASTPNLKGDHGGVEINLPGSDHEGDRYRGYYIQRQISCYRNTFWIFVIFNILIWISGFLYLGSAVALCSNKHLLLMIMKHKTYTITFVSLYTIAIALIIIAAGGVFLARKLTQKIAIHAGCCLLVAGMIVSLAFLQNSAQAGIEADLESQLYSTIKFGQNDIVKDIWDHLHTTFKCCGVRNFLDWCSKHSLSGESHTRTNSTGEFGGNYTCSFPSSCCVDYSYEVTTINTITNTSCAESPVRGKVYNLGCLGAIQAEITYLGTFYKLLSFGTAVSLVFCTTTSMVLLTFI